MVKIHLVFFVFSYVEKWDETSHSKQLGESSVEQLQRCGLTANLREGSDSTG